MRLVAKNHPGEPYNAVGALDPQDAKLLREWWAGGRLEFEERRQHLAMVLAAVAERRAWIACDCLDAQGRPAANPPVLFPRDKDGRYTVQRGTTAGRAEHAEGCPFRWEPGELGGRHGRGPSAPQLLTGSRFLIHRTPDPQLAEREPQAEHLGRRRAEGAQRAQLQTVLFDLLARAGANRFSAGNDSERDDRQLVREACERVLLFDEADLEDIVWTSAKWWTEGWALKRLRKLRAESGWPKSLPMQGFFVVSAKSVSGCSVFCHGGAVLPVEREVELPPNGARGSGPYVAIVSALLDEDSDVLRLTSAYAHPRYCGHDALYWSLCPVDAEAERSTLGALLYVMKSAKAEGAELTLEKPLFAIAATDEAGALRPGFAVVAPGCTLYVQTVASRDPAERSAKASASAALARLGPVIEDERYGIDPVRANKVLIAKVFAALRDARVLPEKELA